MTTVLPSRQRNLTLEICKLIASAFVVFIHVPFPWPAGDLVLCLARFAVPMFFAISGWYSYRATPEKLLRRLGHVLLLELAGITIMLLWNAAAALYTGRDLVQAFRDFLPDRTGLLRWIIFQDEPFGGQLWYLSASAFAYGVLWVYARFLEKRWGWRPMYVLGGCLLAVHYFLGEFSHFTGLDIYSRNYRSGLLMGLPLCLLGRFLREYKEKLPSGTGLLAALFLFGTGLSVAEWTLVGTQELYLGLLLSVPALLLLTNRHPSVPHWMEKAAAFCGPLSTGIYLAHFAFLDIYLGFFQWRLQAYFPTTEHWLQPLAVLALSTGASIGWLLLIGILQHFFRKKV